MKRVAVLVSGGGTNLQALLESERRGENPNGKIELVVASKPGVYALERAANFGVESAVVARRDYADSAAFDAALLETLQSHRIDVVVLAGFLSVLGPRVIEAYRDRILNVHPSLIPSFCGPGFYGLRVHEAALETRRQADRRHRAPGKRRMRRRADPFAESGGRTARRHAGNAAKARDGGSRVAAAAPGAGYGLQRRGITL